MNSSSLAIDLNFNKGNFNLIANTNLSLQGITGIFGPSGCGKTSLLRAIAGLETLSKKNTIIFDNITWNDTRTNTPAHKRPIGYVAQTPTLFKHLNVSKNLNFGLKRTNPHEVKITFEVVVDLLNISELLEHFPHELSGGQKQKIALGRAVLRNPEMLLLDEPLVGLDAKSKDEILEAIIKIEQLLDIPIIYVSHSKAEIIKLASNLVIMESGRIIKSGTLSELRSNLPQDNYTNAHILKVIKDSHKIFIELDLDSTPESFNVGDTIQITSPRKN